MRTVADSFGATVTNWPGGFCPPAQTISTRYCPAATCMREIGGKPSSRSPTLTLQVSNLVSTVRQPSAGALYSIGFDAVMVSLSRYSPAAMRSRVPTGTLNDADAFPRDSACEPLKTSTG